MIGLKKEFKITGNKGFHITFPNGWTVSVQFGPGNYCENNDADFKLPKASDSWRSKDAEVWCFNGDNHYPKEPLASQSPLEVLKILNKISKKVQE